MPTTTALSSTCALSEPSVKWRTFPEMLQQLHGAGVYLHPHQLAEFLVRHGLPVDLCYVPAPLQQRALMINKHYQGDMARLEPAVDQSSDYLDAIIDWT